MNALIAPKVSPVMKGPDMESYSVSTAHEQPATVVLAEWTGQSAGSSIRNGQIIADSAFGTFAYTWRRLGTPFKAFLVDAVAKNQREYIMRKFRGEEYMKFDPQATIESALGDLRSLNVAGDVSDDALADAVAEIEACGHSGAEIMQCLSEIPAFANEVISERVRNSPDPMCVAFWEQVLVPLSETLKEQLQLQKKAASRVVETMGM